MNNQLKTVALLGALSALVVGLGALVVPGHLLLFTLLAVVMNVGAYFFSDRIVLAMHRAQEVSPAEAPELHAMVGELAARAELPMPRIWVLPEAQPNAFATGRDPAHGVVAVTQGLLQALSPREVRGVLAHELAHIKNRDILVSSVAAVAASIITSLAHFLSFGALFGGRREDDEEVGPLGAFVAMLVAPLAATLIQLGISRSREYLADETGARLTDDPEGLARALLRLEAHARHLPVQSAPATASLFIVNPLGAIERLSGWFSTHPSTEERVARLMALERRASPSASWAGSFPFTASQERHVS